MDNHDHLPFKVGQLAESRSFQPGFRGAWFRCKIKDLYTRKGLIGHALEYFDFPDEIERITPRPAFSPFKTLDATRVREQIGLLRGFHFHVVNEIKSTTLYQIPQGVGKKSKDTKRVLMVRPDYPSKYCESQMPSLTGNVELAVIFDGAWKVGDLVDWWTDGCYWSGRVTKILGNDKVQIELPPPPVGEGASYEVFCKDLRPTLDWSPEFGWTVPTPEEGKNSRCCARLTQPVMKGSPPNLEIRVTDEEMKGIDPTSGSSLNSSFSSQISANSLPAHHNKSKRSTRVEILNEPSAVTVPKKSKHKLEIDTDIGKTSLSDSVSSSHVRDALAETAGNDTVEEDQDCYSGSPKKMGTGGSISLNTMSSDTLEAAVMDLEELANRVKWLKGILESGVPFSNGVRPPWKFVEHRGSSKPK